MNFTTIGRIFDEASDEFDRQKGKEPVEFIGNFPHSKSRKCSDLISRRLQPYLKNMDGKMILRYIIIRIRFR